MKKILEIIAVALSVLSLACFIKMMILLWPYLPDWGPDENRIKIVIFGTISGLSFGCGAPLWMFIIAKKVRERKTVYAK